MAIDYKRFDEWERWIPSLQGQRELAATDPGAVASMEIRFMTRAERKAMTRLTVSAALERVSDEEHDKSLREFFDTHVRAIKNLTSEGRPITKGGDLLDVDDDTLAYEITQAMSDRSSLEEGLAGKWLSPSGSKSSGPTLNASGDAPVVTLQPPEVIPEEATSKAI